MVGSIEGSAGSSAYIKSSQLSPGSAAAKKPAQEKPANDVESTSFALKTESVSSRKVEEPKQDTAPAKTELQTQKDDTTLRTEQARGSLLDIAV